MKKSTITLNLLGTFALACASACGGLTTSSSSTPLATTNSQTTAPVTTAANAPAQTAPAAAATKPAASSDSPISITAVELYKAYDKDEPAADAKYKGQQLAVTGIIENITLEGESGVNIDLKAGDFLDTIFCFFDDSEKANVAKLKKGQKVTINGVGEGKFVNPVVRFCEIAG